MRERKFGRIVNISSVNGSKGQFGQCNYAATKAAIHGFTMSLAQECALKNRQPWYVLLGGLVGCQKGKVRPSIQSIIDATCEYYGRTENDLWNEMENVMKEMRSLA